MAYQALYRRYRPRVFADVVGQKQIVTALRHQIELNRIAHAYLFCGTRGTGKTTLAKIFARAVNCLEPTDGEPCGKCTVCDMGSAENPDIIEIDAASNNSVEQVRDLRDNVRFAPVISRFKVYIIDEVHMLSSGAFNALLKTLEEPPAHAIFILATTEPKKLPATILSRCQRYEFKRITINDIMARLKFIFEDCGVSADDESLRLIASAAEGAMRDALSIADQCISFCGNSINAEQVREIIGSMGVDFLFDIADSLIDGDVPACMELLRQVVDSGRELPVFASELERHFRNLMLLTACGGEARSLLDSPDDVYTRFQKQSKRCPLERSMRAIELLARTQGDMRLLTYPRVALEYSLMRICRPEDETTNEALFDRIATLERKLEEGVKVISQTSASPVPEKKPVSAAVAAPAAKFAPKTAPSEMDDASKTLFNALVSNAQPGIKRILASGGWNALLNGDTLEVYAPEQFRLAVDALEKAADQCAESICALRPDTKVRFYAGAKPSGTKTSAQKQTENALTTKTADIFGADNVTVIP